MASRSDKGKRKMQTLGALGKESTRLGAPSKLSASQRRKLVRLYFFTGMALPDICTVLSIGRKQVKKRTVQNILQEMLQVRYNLLRPKDAAMRRARLAQLRGTKTSALVPHRKRRKMEINIRYPEKTPSLQHSERVSSAPDSFPFQNAHSTGELLEYDKGLLREFEKPSESLGKNVANISSVNGGIFDLSAGSCFGVLETPPINTTPFEPPPLYGSMDNIDEEGLKAAEYIAWASHDAIFANIFNGRHDIAYTGEAGQADQAPESIVPLASSEALWNDRFSMDGLAGTFHERPAEPCLADSLDNCFEVPRGDSGNRRTDFAPEHYVFSHADLPIDEPMIKSSSWEPTVDCPTFESVPDLKPSQFKVGNPYVLEGSQFGSSGCANAFHERPSHLDDVPVADSRTTTQGIPELGPESIAPNNHRSLLCERSGGSEKHSIIIVDDRPSTDKLEQDSGSRTSTSAGMALTSRRGSSVSFRSSYSGISSAISRLSGYSESHKAQMTYLTKAFSSSSFSISTKRSSNYSKISTNDIQLPKQDRPDKSLKGDIFTDFHLSELPGDFINSEVNTFATHIDCVQKNAQDFHPEFCKGCCLKTNGVLGNRWQSVRQSVPHALMKYKRSLAGFPHTDVWASKRPDWIDRFGNSTLHIAAALGATFQDLSSIINREADVNYVNTAGQTFMHTLNPWEFFLETPSIPISTFLQNLIDHSFDFGRRDDQGQTFLHILIITYKVNPPNLLKWLPLLCQRDNSGSLIDYDVAYRVVDSVSQFSTQRIYLDKFLKAFNKAQERNGKGSRFNTAQDTPRDLANFRSSSGMNGLHMLGIVPYPVGNHIAIKELVSYSVDIDAYDVRGETPLMKFVQSPHEATAAVYEASLSALLDSGASTARRNRDFETSLHIAVKAGNIVATKALLKRQANVHARDRLGRGVIAIAEAEQRRSIDRVESYAKIAACIALVIDAGAVRDPTLFDEWSLPEGKSSSRPAVYNYSQALPVVKEDSCAVSDSLCGGQNDRLVT